MEQLFRAAPPEDLDRAAFRLHDDSLPAALEGLIGDLGDDPRGSLELGRVF